jgi:hypothetical protein
VTFTARDTLGTLGLAALDVVHDTVVLSLRDLGALESVLGEGVTDLDVLGVLGELFSELLVDLLLDKDSGTGTASLAVVEAERSVSDGSKVIVRTRYPKQPIGH